MCLLVDVKCSKGQPPLLRYSYSDTMIAFLFGLLIIVLIGIYLRSCLSISIIAWSRVDIVCHISLKSHIQSNCILIMMTIELFLIPFFFFLFYVCSLYGIIHIPVCRIQYIPCHEDTVSNSLSSPHLSLSFTQFSSNIFHMLWCQFWWHMLDGKFFVDSGQTGNH